MSSSQLHGKARIKCSHYITCPARHVICACGVAEAAINFCACAANAFSPLILSPDIISVATKFIGISKCAERALQTYGIAKCSVCQHNVAVYVISKHLLHLAISGVSNEKIEVLNQWALELLISPINTTMNVQHYKISSNDQIDHAIQFVFHLRIHYSKVSNIQFILPLHTFTKHLPNILTTWWKNLGYLQPVSQLT